jgi:hypothetical protein
MKTTLKAPRPKRLKLKCDVLLSNIAFKFNLRRYTVDDVFNRFDTDSNNTLVGPGQISLVTSWDDIYDKVRQSVTSKAKHGPITGSDQM